MLAEALPVFKNLLKLAESKNHWAGLIVRGITGLASGRLIPDKDNIHIEKKQGLTYGKGAFYIVLPGVTASLEEHPNGSYILQRIKIDNNYQQLQEDSKKPGLWRVRSDNNATATIQNDVEILNEKFRPVVITDMSDHDAQKTAEYTRKNISKTEGMLKELSGLEGFDMHYTPGGSGIVGLKPAKKALATTKDADITRSAVQLADTMYQARSIGGYCGTQIGAALRY